jgi:hypothetical protein
LLRIILLFCNILLPSYKMIPASKHKGGVFARAYADMRSDQKVLSLKSLYHINHSVRPHACIECILTCYYMNRHVYSPFHWFNHLWSTFEVTVFLSCWFIDVQEYGTAYAHSFLPEDWTKKMVTKT